MLFHDAMRQAVAIAGEIVMDGAADDLTPTDLIRARVELKQANGRFATELAQVVALGAEYVCTVNDPDEAELIAELGSFAGHEHGEANAEHAWRQFIEWRNA